jgi:hypothetical protein
MAKRKSTISVVVISLIAFALAACSTPDTAVNTIAAAPTEPPFKNEEPEKYQTYIVQTTPTETVRFFVARDGARWRVDSAYGAPGQITALHTDKDYILAHGAKTYSEYEQSHGFDERPNMIEEISYGMINGRENAVYEKIGSSDGIVKYKYVDRKGRESIVSYDEVRGLPTSKEIFATNDGTKTFQVSVFLDGFSTDVDPSNFELPKDFKRVTPQEMRSILSSK